MYLITLARKQVEMPRLIKLALSITAVLSFIALAVVQNAAALSTSDWQAGNIISDDFFFRTSEYTPGQIQDFLNKIVPACDTWGTQPYGGTTRAAYSASKGYSTPFTCLKDFSLSIGNVAADNYCAAIPAGTYSAASLIYLVSNSCKISARVLLVLLEKEQSLITDTWPWSIQYQSATGYGCPDSTPGVCDSNYYGFFNQIYRAARQFQLYKAFPASYRYKPFQNNTIYYNPSQSCGSSNIYIQNYATAALYNYTPYQPNTYALNGGTSAAYPNCGAFGNLNFWKLYSNWFGSTVSPYYMCSTQNNLSGSYNGTRLLPFKYSGINTVALTMSNNTGSGCAELHPWALNDYTNWATHYTVSQPSYDGTDGKLVTLDDGSSSSRLVFVKLNSTANAKVEFHEWNKDYRTWKLHQLTDLPLSDLANGTLASVGNRIVYIKYKNTTYGKVEFHVFNEGLTGWAAHIITDQPVSEMDNGTIVARGNRLVFVKTKNTPGSMIEFHEWNDGYTSWAFHGSSNTSLSTAADGLYLN